MTDAELEELREAVRPLYEEAKRLYEELQSLKKVEHARAAFKELLGVDERRLEGLRRRLNAMELEKQSLASRLERDGHEEEEDADEAGRFVIKDVAPGNEVGRGAEPPPVSPPPNPIRPTQARRRFQMLVNRFGYLMGVSDAARAQINQIAEDPQRPLGEALVLLDWNAFEGRVGPPGREGDDSYRERLMEWAEALREYAQKAKGDVREVHVRYGPQVIRQWEAWEASERGDPARWDRLVEETRRAYANESRRLEKNFEALEAEVAALREGLGGG
jgi:hypothetical protein